MKQKMQDPVFLPDYGDEEINWLAQIDFALGRMDGDQRLRVLRFFKGKYSKEWPSDSNY